MKDKKIIKEELKSINKMYNLYIGVGLVDWISKLSKKLLSAETILAFSSGKYSNKQCTVFVTTERILIISNSLISSEIEIPLSQISSISNKLTLSGMKIKITSSSSNVEISNLTFGDKIIESINNGKSILSSPISIQPISDNLDQIKKLKELLDIGAITQEEFENKKLELLNN